MVGEDLTPLEILPALARPEGALGGGLSLTGLTFPQGSISFNQTHATERRRKKLSRRPLRASMRMRCRSPTAVRPMLEAKLVRFPRQ